MANEAQTPVTEKTDLKAQLAEVAERIRTMREIIGLSEEEMAQRTGVTLEEYRSERPGHSERRTYFGDTDVTVQKRTRAALDAGLTVIVCVGEYLEQREQGITDELVAMQTKIALGGVTEEELKRIIIAYEPVWAIGTGKTATAEQANEVCAVIRATVKSLYGEKAAEGITVQYGGSMNAGNAAELLAQPDVDGGLIGGASLKPNDFAAIVDAATKG